MLIHLIIIWYESIARDLKLPLIRGSTPLSSCVSNIVHVQRLQPLITVKIREARNIFHYDVVFWSSPIFFSSFEAVISLRAEKNYWWEVRGDVQLNESVSPGLRGGSHQYCILSSTEKKIHGEKDQNMQFTLGRFISSEISDNPPFFCCK